MIKFHANTFLILTTLNYFWSLAVCKIMTFKVNFLSKSIRIFLKKSFIEEYHFSSSFFIPDKNSKSY